MCPVFTSQHLDNFLMFSAGVNELSLDITLN